MAKPKKQTKSCLGCQDPFITYRNYDYCQNCAINNNRYAQNQCAECGDGSGIVKFRGQKPRPCKICHLTKESMAQSEPTKTSTASEHDPETQFWNEVEEKSKTLIADLIEKTLPISAIPSDFNLEKDQDYQRLLRESLPNSYQESEEYQEKITEQSWTSEDVEYVAQDLTCHYFDVVVGNLIEWLSQHPTFENTRLVQLTQYE